MVRPLDTDWIIVNRNGISHKCPYGDVYSFCQDDDWLLVNRAGKSYRLKWSELNNTPIDDDAFIVNRSFNSYKSLWPDFQPATIVKPTITSIINPGNVCDMVLGKNIAEPMEVIPPALGPTNQGGVGGAGQLIGDMKRVEYRFYDDAIKSTLQAIYTSTDPLQFYGNIDISTIISRDIFDTQNITGVAGFTGFIPPESDIFVTVTYVGDNLRNPPKEFTAESVPYKIRTENGALRPVVTGFANGYFDTAQNLWITGATGSQITINLKAKDICGNPSAVSNYTNGTLVQTEWVLMNQAFTDPEAAINASNPDIIQHEPNGIGTNLLEWNPIVNPHASQEIELWVASRHTVAVGVGSYVSDWTITPLKHVNTLDVVITGTNNTADPVHNGMPNSSAIGSNWLPTIVNDKLNGDAWSTTIPLNIINQGAIGSSVQSTPGLIIPSRINITFTNDIGASIYGAGGAGQTLTTAAVIGGTALTVSASANCVFINNGNLWAGGGGGGLGGVGGFGGYGGRGYNARSESYVTGSATACGVAKDPGTACRVAGLGSCLTGSSADQCCTSQSGPCDMNRNCTSGSAGCSKCRQCGNYRNVQGSACGMGIRGIGGNGGSGGLGQGFNNLPSPSNGAVGALGGAGSVRRCSWQASGIGGQGGTGGQGGNGGAWGSQGDSSFGGGRGLNGGNGPAGFAAGFSVAGFNGAGGVSGAAGGSYIVGSAGITFTNNGSVLGSLN